MGRRIAEERERAGYTQAKLAERVGLSEKAMQRIELGAPTSTQRLLDIARALGVDAAVFFMKPASRKRRVGRPPRTRS
jgi:transcriptional regulator with XRE-family HTH domain